MGAVEDFTVFLSAGPAPARSAQEDALRSVETYLGESLSGRTPDDSASRSEFLASEQALGFSSAVIADLTPGSPNVLLELGRARAFDIPLLVIAPEGSNLPSALGISPDAIIHYPSVDRMRQPRLWGPFDESLEKALEGLKKTAHKGQRVLATARAKLLSSLSGDRTEQLSAGMSQVLAGWTAKIAEEVGSDLPTQFRVDSDYYVACFEMFDETDKRSAKAIADLSRTEESFWIKDYPAIDLNVGERIFLMRSDQIFDNAYLEGAFRALKGQASRSGQYKVRVARSDGSMLVDHVFDGSPSQDLIVLRSGLVAGYVQDGPRKYLQVVNLPAVKKTADAYYARILAESCSVKRAWRAPAELRAAWARRYKLGLWETDWQRGRRSRDYYEKYDANIRLWLPGYEGIVQRLAERVSRRIAELYEAAGGSTVRVLEIGLGTGYLTLEIARRLSVELGNRCRNIEYVALDHSAEMLAMAKERLRLVDESDSFPSLELRQIGFGDLDGGTEFDVILGSFVINQFLEQEGHEKGLTDFVLKTTQAGRRERCCAFFVDGILGNDQTAESARQWWLDEMCRLGLARREAEAFLDGNEVMLTMTDEELRSVALGHGWTRFLRLPLTNENESPFLGFLLEREATRTPGTNTSTGSS